MARADKWRIACVDDGVLVIDGKPHHTAPRGRQWSGTTVYMVDGSIQDVALDYGCGGDVVGSPHPPYIHSIDFVCGDGHWTLRDGDAWGLPENPDAARLHMEEILAACRDEGFQWSPTAASTARRIGKKILPWLGSKNVTLGERYEAGWRRALTVGPMVVCRAKSSRAQQLDLKSAFLEGMYVSQIFSKFAPIPPGTKWADVRRYDGFVTAVVMVPDSCFVGPLPVGCSGARPWPTGTFVGTWPIVSVRAAENFGAIVLFIADGAVGYGEEMWIHPLAERIGSVANQKLRKSLYTRWWSRWASEGWYSAKLPKAKWATEAAEWERLLGTKWQTMLKTGARESREAEYRKLEWNYEPTWYGERRPDLSATIAAHAWHPLVSTIQSHGRDVIAAHVDALWTERVSEVPSEFALKGDGPARFYSIGVYEHAGKVKAQGCPPYIKSRQEKIKWAARGCAPGTNRGRVWSEGFPATSDAAVSEPLKMEAFENDSIGRPTWNNFPVTLGDAVRKSCGRFGVRG